MMRTLIILIFLVFSFQLKALRSNPCDSLTVDCCTITLSAGSLSLQVTNSSSYIFPYPGFILFNSDGDTVAQEIVNYYGIGNYLQEHLLVLKGSIELPFEGYLELHCDFYAFYSCTFPVMIEDSVSTAANEIGGDRITLFPNPASSKVHLNIPPTRLPRGGYMQVYNTVGIMACSRAMSAGQHTLSASEIGGAGLYYLLIFNRENRIIERTKLLIN